MRHRLLISYSRDDAAPAAGQVAPQTLLTRTTTDVLAQSEATRAPTEIFHTESSLPTNITATASAPSLPTERPSSPPSMPPAEMVELPQTIQSQNTQSSLEVSQRDMLHNLPRNVSFAQWRFSFVVAWLTKNYQVVDWSVDDVIQWADLVLPQQFSHFRLVFETEGIDGTRAVLDFLSKFMY